MKDLKFTDDLVIKDGDFVIDESDRQFFDPISCAEAKDHKGFPN